MPRTDKQLRIAIMSKPLDNWTSGSGHHLDEMVKHILDLDDPALNLTLVHYTKSENPVYQRAPELIIPRNPFAASSVVARQGFDIIHYAPLSVYAPVWGVAAKKTATVHGIEEVLYPEGYSLVQRIHETKIQPVYMRAMDGIATVSETSKHYFAKVYRVPADKIVVTYNALSGDYRTLEDTCPGLNDPPVPDTPFVLHISRYSKRKNPACILNGFAEYVRRTGDDCVLVCAGKGWDSDEVRAAAAQAGIADRYVAPGFIDTETAVRLLNRASVFLFPSFAEGFGMPNIEAMACGCPVITSSIFAIPEVVGDAAVLLKDPRDYGECAEAIAKVLKNDCFRDKLVQRGYRQITRYDWSESAKKLVDLWKRIGGKE